MWVARCVRAPGALQSSAGLEGQATGESLSGTEIRANSLKDSSRLLSEVKYQYKAVQICIRNCCDAIKYNGTNFGGKILLSKSFTA